MLSLALLLVVAAHAAAGPLEEAREAIHYNDYARAAALLEPEAARGNAEAARRLGELYDSGRGVPTDARKAYALFRQAEAGADGLGTWYLYWALTRGVGVEASTTTAQALVPKAVKRLEAAAAAGDWRSMERLANMFRNGFGPAANPSQAIAWQEKEIAALTQRAHGGDPYFQYELGLTLLVADPALRDPDTGKQWLQRSADQGFQPAISELADLRDCATCSPEDKAAALATHRKLCAQGFASGCWGVAHERASVDEEVDAYRKAAQTSAFASALMAIGYRDGEHNLTKDPEESIRWAYRAAKSGEPRALGFLSRAYAKGEGVSADKAEAYKWARLGAWQGDYDSKAALKELGATLTEADKSEGLRRAESFAFVAYPTEPPQKRSASKPAAATEPAAAAAPVAAPPARLSARDDDFAVVVGIERYNGLPSADYAESDAAAMRQRLVALGFPERNVISLLGEQATRSKLQAYLDEWLPRNVPKGGRVFFYFSGHGSPDAKTGQAYLVPADGDPAFLKSTALPLKDLYASLNALPARQVIVALDSCFSGAGGRSVLAKGMRPLVNKVEISADPGSGKLVVLAAAQGDQTTGGLDEQRQGAFTHFLIEGLEGGAENKSGAITAGGLEAFVKPRVADAARRQNRDQTPVLIGDPASVLFKLK